jgi:hypothetical protein
MDIFQKKVNEFESAANTLHGQSLYANDVVTQNLYYACFLRLKSMMSTYFFTQRGFEEFEKLYRKIGNSSSHEESLLRLSTLISHRKIVNTSDIKKAFDSIRILKTNRHIAAYKPILIEDFGVMKMFIIKQEVFKFCMNIESIISNNKNTYPKIASITIQNKVTKLKWRVSYTGGKSDDSFYTPK